MIWRTHHVQLTVSDARVTSLRPASTALVMVGLSVKVAVKKLIQLRATVEWIKAHTPKWIIMVLFLWAVTVIETREILKKYLYEHPIIP